VHGDLPEPVLKNSDMEKLRRINEPGLKVVTLPILFNPNEGKAGLEKALKDLFRAADRAIAGGATIVILSDKGVDRLHAPIPALLASSGLHHHLIRNGTRHVIVEKPICTTVAQLEDLLKVLNDNPEAKLHCAFQKRYSPVNAFVLTDLGSSRISMSATVYEVALPKHHWYRWPSSGNARPKPSCSPARTRTSVRPQPASSRTGMNSEPAGPRETVTPLYDTAISQAVPVSECAVVARVR
jgi:hypothetical protein